MKRSAAVLLLLAASCEDDSLRELHPSISVCAQSGAPAAECDRDIDLGEIPIQTPTTFTIFIVDRGDANLNVHEVTPDLDAVEVAAKPELVAAGAAEPVVLEIELPVAALGDGAFQIVFASDDEERREHTIRFHYVGTPKPVPNLHVCIADTEECDDGAVLDFGVVRRTQREGRTLIVENRGTAELRIDAVAFEGAPSLAGEIELATSVRAATMAPGDAAPVVVVYTPQDDVDDEVTLTFTSDDPDTPMMHIVIRGRSEPNLPPIAVAWESISTQATAAATVDDVVELDGTDSSDPEGDPLHFAWTLVPPSGSATTIDDPTAARITFTPDRAGTYHAELVVRDSLDQESLAAVVVVTAAPRFGFRAQLEWAAGGDLDVHVVPQGEALFSQRDCSFEHRLVDFADPASSDDDCILLDDAVDAPGPEQAVFKAPAAGTFGVYVNVFDDDGLGPLDATVRLIVDDAASPIFLQTQTLPQVCSVWHVADVTWPGPVLSATDAPLGTDCRTP